MFDEDPFAEVAADEAAWDAGETMKEKESRMASEIKKLIGVFQMTDKSEEKKQLTLMACEELTVIFKENPNLTSSLIYSHGIIPILEMLEWDDHTIIRAVLKVVNEIVASSQLIRENFTLVGGIPAVMRFSNRSYPSAIRYATSIFVRYMCSTSTLTLQMFIAARGLPVLVDLVSTPYEADRDLVWMAIDGISSVFELQTPTPKNDFCRLFAKVGLLGPLCVALQCCNQDNSKEAQPYVDKIANILLFFSNADTLVKFHLAKLENLKIIFSVLESATPDVLTKLFKAIKNLSMDLNILLPLQVAGALRKLVRLLLTDRYRSWPVEKANM